MRTLWKDRKRFFGLPLSFTRYSLTEDRIFRVTGVLNLREEEVPLYRVHDVSLYRPLSQRIFGVGTIHVYSSDRTAPTLEIKSVKKPRDVKELIFAKSLEAAQKYRVRRTELLAGEVDGELNNEDDAAAEEMEAES